MKNTTSLLIPVFILLASCVPSPLIESAPIFTQTALPTETIAPKPIVAEISSLTLSPTLTPLPTEISMNPDWLVALNTTFGTESQFPMGEGSPLLCAIDVKSARSVNLTYNDREILSVADCYYQDINSKTQVISVAVVSYDATEDAVYSLGSARSTKGLGKPGAGYIEKDLANTAQIMSPEGKALIFMLMISNPSAEFLATGNPASFPTLGDAENLVAPTASAVALGR